MNRTAVEHHSIDAAGQQAAIQRPFGIPFSEESGMADFDAVVKTARQAVEKAPQVVELRRGEAGRQLQPVLTDAIGQRLHQAKEIGQQVIAVLQRRLMADGIGKLKAEAKRIVRHIAPAHHRFRIRQRIERGISLNTMEIAGIVRQAFDAPAFPV